MKKIATSLILISFAWLSLVAQNTPDTINAEALLNPEEVVESAIPFDTAGETPAPEKIANPEDIVNTAVKEEILTEEGTGVLMETYEERNWIDGTRDWLYGKSQGTVEWLDTGIIKEPDPVPTPPSRFRVGLYTQIDLEADGAVKFAPVADFDVDVDLPNLESRLKLFISTKDPTALPGQDAFDSDNGLRVGASRSMFNNWKSSVGIKTKWPPEPFAYVQWSPEYNLTESWSMVPQLRPFWESEDGFGGMTSVVFGRWKNRRMFRQAFSLKWTQELEDEDDKSEVNEESSQYGYNGGGYRWDATTIWGYVPALINERDYGRRVGGDDVAKGIGLKARVTGNEVKTTKATLTLFLKRPAYKDFLYFVLGPEVVWAADSDWDEEFVLKAGFEMLVWGDPVLK